METLKAIISYIAIYGLVIFCVWWGAKFFADSISDIEIVSPKDGIECAVVSRAFNTSIDCWEKK